MARDHCRLVLETAERDLDRLAAELWRQGTSGWQEEPPEPKGEICRIIAYFDSDRFDQVAAVSWAEHGARRVSVDVFAADDWMEHYRELSTPAPLGDRFLVDPREPGAEPPADRGQRVLLRLPAREAFGTGSHESTRLAVELLERSSLEGATVLDVGTGTGVLSFVARSLGARAVFGFDVDPAAAIATAENSVSNRLEVSVWCGTLSALGDGACFDVVVANVRPERLGGDYAGLARRLRRGGSLLLSGFLVAEEPRVSEIAAASRLEVVASRELAEWGGWALRRPR